MTTTQRDLTALGIVPRAPRLPSDLASLLVADPMTETALALGGRALAQRWQRAATHGALAPLIAAALAGR